MGKKKRNVYPGGYYDEITGGMTYDNPNFNHTAGHSYFQHQDPSGNLHHANDYYRGHERNYKSPKRSNYNNKFKKRKRKRSPSPKAGTHKYMEKRIKQMSTNIMQHIMNPDLPNDLFNLNETSTEEVPPESTKVQNDRPVTELKKKIVKQQKSSTKKSQPVENQADVQEKIMTHLSNLREGKKKNIINLGSSNYDIAVQKIVQQRRLELSRVLRNMQSGNNQNMECMDLLNTIIPDMGISLEELPQQYIYELNRALQLEQFDDDTSFNHPDEQIETTSSEDASILNVLDNIICKLNSNTSGVIQGRNIIDPPIEDPKSTAVNLENIEVKEEPIEVLNSTTEIKVEPEVDEFENLERSNPEILILSSEIKKEPESDDCILITDENTLKETDNSEVKQEPVIEDCVIFSDENMVGMETEETATAEITLNDHVRLNIISETDDSIIQQCNSDDILNNREPVEQVHVSVQTENSIIAELLEEQFKETPNTLQGAVQQLLEIDKWVSTLAEYRKYLVMNLTHIAKREEKSNKVNFTKATKKRTMKTNKNTVKKSSNSIKFDGKSGNSNDTESTNNNNEGIESIKTLPKRKKRTTIQNSISNEGETNTSHNEKDIESPLKPSSKPLKTSTIQNFDTIEATTSHNDNTVIPPSTATIQSCEENTNTSHHDGGIKTPSKSNNKHAKKTTIQNPDDIESDTSHIVEIIDRVLQSKKLTKKATIQNSGGIEDKTTTSHYVTANIEPVLQLKKSTKKANIQNSDNVEDNTSHNDEAVEVPSKATNKPTKKAITKKSNKTNQKFKASQSTLKREKGTTDINANLGKIENILVSENEVVTVVKSTRETLLVGTENGKVLIFNTNDGFLSHHLQFSRQPIKSIFCNESERGTFIFVLNNTVEGCNLNCEALLEDISSPREPRCMDSKWGYLFIGCTAGWFVRYSIQKNACEYEDVFYGGTIGAIKALMEGVRRILLIVSLTYPVCIRDAMTGLPLRTFERCYVDSPIDTIWVQDKYLYCGGKGVHVLVLSFNEGAMIKKIKVGDNITRKCFKTYNHLLLTNDFSSNISVFNTKTGKLVKTLEGPHNGIHCMEIVVDQIFTTNRLMEFKTIPIPKELLK